MIYLKKLLVNDEIIVYMYGTTKDIFIGELEINRNNFSLPPKKYLYVEGHKVETNELTYEMKQAILGIASFIRKNEFPAEYLRATH